MFSGVPNGPLRLSPPQVHAAVHNSGSIFPNNPFYGEIEIAKGMEITSPKGPVACYLNYAQIHFASVAAFVAGWRSS